MTNSSPQRDLLAAVPEPDLDRLAREIRTEAEQAEAAWRDAVSHAVRAGELLTEAKAKVGHGRWLPWLDAVGLPRRTASTYMRLASNGPRVAHLGSVRQAVAVLAEKEPAPPREDIASVQSQWRKLERVIASRPGDVKRKRQDDASWRAMPWSRYADVFWPSPSEPDDYYERLRLAVARMEMVIARAPQYPYPGRPRNALDDSFQRVDRSLPATLRAAADRLESLLSEDRSH